MGFVVKGVSPSGEVMWVGLFRYAGRRALGSREAAEVFETPSEAQSAIDELPAPLVGSGITFTIEIGGATCKSLSHGGGRMDDSKPIQFLVTATGANGVFWLSKPSEIGLRTLVARDQAELFPSIEAAEHAIKRMPKGYKLARVSFAIELAAEVRSLRR